MLQIAKVSKILHAINQGQLSNVAGKDFDAIDFNLDEGLEDEEGPELLTEKEPVDVKIDSSLDVCQSQTKMKSPRPSMKMSNDISRVGKRHSNMNGKNLPSLKKKKDDDDYVPEDVSILEENTDNSDEEENINLTKKSADGQCKRKPWTSLEVSAVQKSLGLYIQRQILPGKKMCQDAIKNETALAGRSWKSIKYLIKNRITAMKKKKCCEWSFF